jgi:hypothetical protein
MALFPARRAKVGVRADKHPAPQIIDDHLVQIASIRAAQVTVMLRP